MTAPTTAGVAISETADGTGSPDGPCMQLVRMDAFFYRKTETNACLGLSPTSDTATIASRDRALTSMS